MAVRDEVRSFCDSGPLPDLTATAELIKARQEELCAIVRPVSDEEAELLAHCFGPDDCYELAWVLLHLIETAPHSPIRFPPHPTENEWRHYLWERMQRAKESGP